MEGFEVRKGRGKCYNYIISKVKEVLKIKKKKRVGMFVGSALW